MKWIEATFELYDIHDHQAIDLIAAVFYDIGLTGVVIADPDLAPAEGWAEDGAVHPERPAVTGYLPLDSSGRERLASLYREQLRLREHLGLHLQLRHRTIDEENWAESWKEFFKPFKVDQDLIIKPSWESIPAQSGTIVIDIDPGMAFGTGTHPTTVLCLRLIRSMMVKGSRFLDVGTGSGILSIAAAQFGAGSIVAVDTDASALQIAAENLARNRIEPERYQMAQGHLVDGVTGRFDFVVANILTDVILELLTDLNRVLKPGGIFVCSGIIPRHREGVVAALLNQKFDILAVEMLDGWLGFATQRGSSD